MSTTDPSAEQYLYDLADGDASMRPLLGGKGANVAEMMRLGVPVPDGFTVSTAASIAAMRTGGDWPDGLWDDTIAALQRLEERTGRALGSAQRPLLVSVRSGAVVSMPGMMDTILNLGVSDETVEALGAEADNPRFAWDSYRRFIQMYGEVVEEVPAYAYEDALSAMKRKRGVEHDTELSIEDLQALVEQFKEVSREHMGEELPEDPRDQLRRSIDAVFRSWKNPRAGVYRKAHGIPDDLGTAVNVMQMVFGNRGQTSATGVCFTRNPSTGAKELYGEFLVDAQGEDVVAGIRTPRDLAEMQEVLPEAFEELVDTMRRLEEHYGDMQDIEFTVEEGTLYLLQTRSGKRTAPAAFKIARDMVAEDVLTREQALRRIEPAQLDQLLHPAIDPEHDQTPVTKGLNASPGAAVGEVVFDAETAEQRGKAGDAVVLVRWETAPDDIAGVIVAQGVLTAHGGMTSHAAVVARGMGKPCVVGCEGLSLDLDARTVQIGEHR
ncbi:MAG: pyruvate, phosphate dikinase, partial [Actinobacteria bacterium]|nr:pyruvate, phosphate dikinase [Actinomycetota bacterium]